MLPTIIYILKYFNHNFFLIPPIYKHSNKIAAGGWREICTEFTYPSVESVLGRGVWAQVK